MLIWGFLCQITLVIMRYTRNLNIMNAWKLIHEIQNVLHSCPYYFTHKIMLFFRFMNPSEIGMRRRRRRTYQCFFVGPLPLRNSFLEKEKLLQLLLLLLLQEGVTQRWWSKEEALVHPSPPPPCNLRFYATLRY